MPQSTPTSTYTSTLRTVAESQDEALAQAREMLDQTENPVTHQALESAIKEMERAKTALATAKDSPEKLPAAIAAEQAAYQALLKMIPRETRVSRSRRASRGGSAGQAGQEQLNQLELTSEENRYETERQASAAPTEQQREQLRIADRLKELAQRQQDLNERLKELQTALTEARTEQEREEAQRQLKRLTDEEKQMLANMDELRQQLDSSPNANSLSKARQQLEQTRSDTQRAAQELENKSASQALAAGTRAQQEMEKLRSDLRSQTSSQFAEQMRQMRNQARDLAREQEEIGKAMESLNNLDHKSLEDSTPRKQLGEKMARQQSALTNLLSNMQTVSEQAESSEPLLSQQLYDTLRRENQTHTENLLDASAQMVERGLLPQAAEAEGAARTNINELKQKIERAAESVLGNEGDALRYAQKELDDLANRLERELANGETNSNAAAASQGGSNSSSRAHQSQSGASDTNSTADREGQQASGQNSQTGEQQAGTNQSSSGNSANSSTRDNQRNGNKNNGQQAGDNPQPGEQQSNGGQKGAGNQANNSAQNNQRNGNSNNNGQQATAGNSQSGDQQQPGDASGNGSDTERLSQLARRIGANNGTGGLSYGPITGNDFVDWSSRMRDVEQVLDAPNMRNQLATARERLAEFRAQFRQSRIKPKSELVRRQILDPIAEVRTQLREDLARMSNASSLVPLDHDPVPDNYSELVRKYYEKLGDGR
ncbi:MAG TPA: hypothetical protein VG754_05705 [Verrucomicrobiae bacterium]|nr:hypothetical protein [Verrucomicrobiae bacterium]